MRRDLLRSLEAIIVGLFWVQSVRYLIAALYADVSSADLVQRSGGYEALSRLHDVVDPALVRAEVMAAAAVLLAPLLGVVLSRMRWSIPLAVAVVVIARTMTLQLPESSVLAAALVVAGGLLYLTLVAVRRPRYLPITLAMAFAADTLLRAFHDSTDPTFDPDFLLGGSFDITGVVIAMAFFALFITALTTIIEREEQRLPGGKLIPGVLTIWGALALGGITYLEFTVLALPNAAARWADVDYHLMLPLLLLATLLPLVPEVRGQAANFLSMFDGNYRGWLWTLMLGLFMLIGKRFDGPAAVFSLTMAQFFAILTLWWLVKQPTRQRVLNQTPFLILVSAIIFLLLVGADYFTYDYAFVRPFAAPFGFLSDILSGMKGFGIGIVGVSVVLACLPMVLERQIIPWRPGRAIETVVSLAGVLLITVAATRAAVPPSLQRPLTPDCLRVVSLNMHSGYTQYFNNNLEAVADMLLRSGADIVLLQEVDAGRLTSGSMDQAIWLANRLNMHPTFYPLDEDLRGLAILSRLDVTETTGARLTSEGAQAGVQVVRYRLDDAGDLTVYNVWFGFEVEERGGAPVPSEAQDQVIQQSEIARLIAAEHFSENADPLDRVVLGGTFNYEETSPLYAQWNETVFIDPFSSLFSERRYTFVDTLGVTARYDYLWLHNLLPSGVNVDLNNQASDHRPILAAFGRVAGSACPS